MAPSSSKSAAPAKDNRRKSSSASKDSKVITLKVSSDRLRKLLAPASADIKEDTPIKDVKDSTPANSPPVVAPAASNPEIGSESNPATPANGGTPAPSVMGPPDTKAAAKKGGVKRSAGAANGDGKPRGKPGPKKRQRMEDGSLEPIRGNAHRLGPKANQGAINAGLRALDRTGKPCRKWAKGGFRLKTFTGVEWEIKRWVAPPKPKPVEATPEGLDAAAADGVLPPTSAAVSTADNSSSKENKNAADLPAKSENNSNSGGDVEMQSISSVPASSPAPMPVAAGA